MRPEAKAQIYSLNEVLPANQVARMWGVLDQLERTRGKRKGWRSRRRKSKLQVVKFVCLDVYQSFTMVGGSYYTPCYHNPNRLRQSTISNKPILIDQNTTFQPEAVSNQICLSMPRHPIGTKSWPIAFSCTPSPFSKPTFLSLIILLTRDRKRRQLIHMLIIRLNGYWIF